MSAVAKELPGAFLRLSLRVGLPGCPEPRKIPWVESLEANLMFVASGHGFAPYHAKLGFVLLILHRDQAPHFEWLTQRAQTDTG